MAPILWLCMPRWAPQWNAPATVPATVPARRWSNPKSTACRPTATIIAPPGVPLHYPEHEAITVFGKREEYEAALRGDPVPRFRATLIKSGVLTPAKADELSAQAAKEMAAAVAFAVKSPFPALESALDNIYA